MGLKRYTGSADNTITNAFQGTPWLKLRATGSNMGQADVTQIFSVWGRNPQSSSAEFGSQELSRALIKFPIATVSSDRSEGKIPASGSVNFYLRMFNAYHTQAVPENYTLSIHAVSRSWQEGSGMDMINFQDETRGFTGSNWMSASNTTAWTDYGGDYLTASTQWDYSGSDGAARTKPPMYRQDFKSGLENLEVDITGLVEHWISGTIGNYGVGVMLSSSYETYYNTSVQDGGILPNTGGVESSYYVKRFFARGTQYYYNRPLIEARWDSTKRDDRGGFYYSSSLGLAEDNVNTLYLYNYVRGRLRNIPAIGTTGSIMVSLYSGSSGNTAPSGSKLILYNSKYAITGGYVETGVYSASLGLTASTDPIRTLYDVWWSGSTSQPGGVTRDSAATEFATGSIIPITTGSVDSFLSHVRTPKYFINITNLRNKYTIRETARFKLFVREKNWNPTVYTKATTVIPSTAIVSASYRVVRTLDALEVIPHGTSSNNYSGLSFDKVGNYFDLDIGMLQQGYEYALRFAFYDPELLTWTEQDKSFKFRVMADEY